MKLRLLFFIITLIGFFANASAQNYPYLNASTGNEGTFIIDVDSNIYMFHNSQIEKVDKNFNPIWVKTYNGISFFSLLLSKNGSLYFIATDTISIYSQSNIPMRTKYIGKIDASGDLIWCKTADNSSLNLSINFYKLLLDRNNDLMASCNLGLMKLDTIGNMYYLKHFQTNLGTVQNLDIIKATILKDSMGVYSCAFTWQAFETAGIGRFEYNEALDTFNVQNSFNEYPQFWGVNDAWFYQSKYDVNVYYSITAHSLNGPGSWASFFSIRKHRNGNIIWNKKMGGGSVQLVITSFEEDTHKNILFNISPLLYSGNYYYQFSNNNYKLDSNGVYNGIKSTLLSYSGIYRQANLQALYNNTYFYTVVGNGFSTNPLSITILDSTLVTSCATTTPWSMLNQPNGSMSTDTFLLKHSIAPYILQDKAINVSPILNFTTAASYCIILDIADTKKVKEELNVYPNPCQKSLHIQNKDGVTISSIYIIDVYGKQTKVNYDNNQIKTEYLSNGVYFIKIQTDKGEFSQKFIKE